MSYILFFLEDTSRRDNIDNRRRRNSSAANLAKKLTALRMTCKACNNVAMIEKAALFHIELRKAKVMEALKRQHIEDLFDEIWNPVVVAGKRKSWTFALWCMIPIVDSEWECLIAYVLPGFRTCAMDDMRSAYWQMPSQIRTGQLNIHYGARQPLTHDIHNPLYSFVDWFKRVTSSGQIDNQIQRIIEQKVKNGDSVSGQRVHTLKLHPGCIKRTNRYPPALPCPLCGRYKRTSAKDWCKTRGHYAWRPNELEILRCPMLPQDDTRTSSSTIDRDPAFTPESLEKMYAFLLGTHPRTGLNSLAMLLPKSLIHIICDFVREPSESDLVRQLKTWVAIMKPGENLRRAMKRIGKLSEARAFLHGRTVDDRLFTMRQEHFEAFFKTAHKIKCLCGIPKAILSGRRELSDNEESQSSSEISAEDEEDESSSEESEIEFGQALFPSDMDSDY